MELRTGDQPMVIETAGGKVRMRKGTADHPAAVITGKPGPVLGLLTGRLDLREARRRGLELKGNPKVLSRLVPAGVYGE